MKVNTNLIVTAVGAAVSAVSSFYVASAILNTEVGESVKVGGVVAIISALSLFAALKPAAGTARLAGAAASIMAAFCYVAALAVAAVFDIRSGVPGLLGMMGFLLTIIAAVWLMASVVSSYKSSKTQ